jgi:hypothetical protein
MPHGVDLRVTVLLRELRAALLVLPLTIDRPDLGFSRRRAVTRTALATTQCRSVA